MITSIERSLLSFLVQRLWQHTRIVSVYEGTSRREPNAARLAPFLQLSGGAIGIAPRFRLKCLIVLASVPPSIGIGWRHGCGVGCLCTGGNRVAVIWIKDSNT